MISIFKRITPSTFLLFLLPPLFFHLFRFSFNEELLLLLASLLFFGFFGLKARGLASDFFGSKIEEVYSGFADLFLLKLNRLLLLLRFIRKSTLLFSLVGAALPPLFLALERVKFSELELGELYLRLVVKRVVVGSILGGERTEGSILLHLAQLLSNRFRASASTEFRLTA